MSRLESPAAPPAAWYQRNTLTGILLCVSTLTVSLPISTAAMPLRPWDAMHIASQTELLGGHDDFLPDMFAAVRVAGAGNARFARHAVDCIEDLCIELGVFLLAVLARLSQGGSIRREQVK